MSVSTPNSNSRLDVKVVVSLKYVINFWRHLELSLFYCKIELDLSWTRYCVMSEMSRTYRAVGDPPVQQITTAATSRKFSINNTKLCVPVVTLSFNDNIKFLENIKQGFTQTLSWNKYRFEITTQLKNSNLYFLINPTFRNTNRLFVLLFKNDNDNLRE